MYDDLTAWSDTIGRLLHRSSKVIQPLAHLYMSSGFAAHTDLVAFLNGGSPPDVVLPPGPLDAEIKKLLENKKRFRASLAEHLGFWIPLASALSAHKTVRAAAQPPHVLTEDTGPDGLLIKAGPPHSAELISVKNSISDPTPLISSAKFRTSRRARPGLLLDDFHLLATKNKGFTKTLRLVTATSSLAKLDLTQQMQIALLGNVAYHAFVVASHQHGKSTMFAGFSHIADSAARRIGTFAGADVWAACAELVRKTIVARMKAIGAW